jgi:3-oxoacyl-[acyl-carrier protein] reductase
MIPAAPAGRVVLITGAAGGLGAGLVAEFVSQGWAVIAGYHRRIPPNVSPRVLTAPLDVTRRDSVDAAVSEGLARWGRVDALVHCAGVVADKPLWQMDAPHWDGVMDVNLKGAWHGAQALLPAMMAQRDGHMVFISSFSARLGARGQANYAAAKAGLLGFTQSLARELGPHNVRVNAVLPGVLPTAMTAGLAPGQMAAFAEANALGRLNAVAEVARFVAFLVTLQNVSGQVFQLDSRIARWT